ANVGRRGKIAPPHKGGGRGLRWRAENILPAPRRGSVAGGEFEGRGMTEPAIEGLRGLPVMTCRGVDEGRRARPAIEILVAAADREIRLRSVEIHRQRAGSMGQVPDRKGTRGV